MDLDAFVKQTLLDVTNAVADAQSESKLFIAPGYVEGEKVTSPQMVSFDIAVTTNKEGGGGISVLSFGEVKAGLKSEVSNRIAFEVPVYFQAPTSRNSRHFTNRPEFAEGNGENHQPKKHVLADQDGGAEEE